MFDNFERFSNLFKKLQVHPIDLSGKHALVTGGSEGIGFHTALNLAKMGCAVTIASRSEQKCKDAVESLKKLSNNDLIDYETLDLGSFQSVKDFAEKFNKRGSLNYLINNGGVVYRSFDKTSDGIEKNTHVNHLGSLQLTLLLLPIIKKAENPRIIFLASDCKIIFKFCIKLSNRSIVHLDTSLNLPYDLESHQFPVGLSSYSKSKLMNVLTVKKLAREIPSSEILICAVHPGFVATGLPHKNTSENWKDYLMSKVVSIMELIFARTPEQGSVTSVYTVTASDIVHGEYYDSCKVSQSNPQAEDTKLADELWNESLKMINIDPSTALKL
jgi:NAD(P)-dependent dehydrogenase (short-subunit alcohol dehydrogenase family)